MSTEQTAEIWTERLEFAQIDAETRRRVCNIRPVLLQEMPGIVERFYTHIMKFGSLKTKFAGQDRVRFARDAQIRHLGMLLECVLDEKYRDSASKIGLTHHRVGLTPQWFIGGYSHILEALLACVARHYGGAIRRPGAHRDMIATQQALSRVVLLDMELAISAYWSAHNDERRDTINTMIDRIDKQVSDVVGSVTSYTRDLVGSAERMAGVSFAVNHHADSASAAADDALQSAQTVASAAEELHASIAEIAHQVNQSSNTAREVVSFTTRARGVVGQLGEAANKIGQVVQLISTIASQTNLLALNATIEAARAGEVGRGFAVVAGEVKTLARQSAESADEITLRIRNIQEATQSTVRVIDQVAETISNLERTSGSISTAVEEQTAATQEIARNVVDTADRVSEVSRTMQSVTESVEKANQAAYDVAESAVHMDSTLGSMGSLLTKAVRTSSAIANRRQVRRRAVILPAEVTGQDGSEKVQVFDLSVAGALFTTQKAYSEGARVTLSASDEGIRAQGKVVACIGGNCHVFFEGNPITPERVLAIAKDSIGRIVELAKGDHRKFVANISEALEGRNDLTVAKITTHHTCRLGRWYDSVSDDILMDLPAFKALVEPHREVHAKAREVLLARDRNQGELARARMAELETLSRQIVSVLDGLARAVEQGAL